MVYILFLLLEITGLYFLSRRVNQKVFHFFFQVTKRRNWSMYLFAIVYLPGTFIHEISHFLAALFLLVPVGELELLPKFKEEGGGVDLGSVGIGKTDPVRRFLIGVAPFIFGILIIFTILYLILTDRFSDVWWGNILAGILIFEVANSMFASKKDMEGALVLFLFSLFVIAFLFVLGIRIPVNLTDLSFSESAIELLKNANVFFLAPIVIDALVLFVLKD